MRYSVRMLSTSQHLPIDSLRIYDNRNPTPIRQRGVRHAQKTKVIPEKTENKTSPLVNTPKDLQKSFSFFGELEEKGQYKKLDVQK